MITGLRVFFTQEEKTLENVEMFLDAIGLADKRGLMSFIEVSAYTSLLWNNGNNGFTLGTKDDLDGSEMTLSEAFHHIDEINRNEKNEMAKDIEVVPSTFASEVHKITDALAAMLISKNKKYGNSALEPKRIFSNASPVEQILVRIDDKLSRMSNQDGTDDEDVVEDLLGYLVLLKIAKNSLNSGELKEA